MILFNTPSEMMNNLQKKTKERRLQLNLTQKELAEKSCVALPTLQKYERTGQISLESFVKILFVLDLSQALMDIFNNHEMTYNSMDDLLNDIPSKPRKRASKRRKNKDLS